MTKKPEVYFHVGLGKVASTYLQQQFFPRLKNIHYIPPRHYKKSKKIIAKGFYTKFLVSREFDRQFEREVAWFTETYPDTRIIVLFRRHESWIASQYRRYVKNGWHWDFTEFFDVKHDNGFWKRQDLYLYHKLEIIEKYTCQKPLILFYDDLQADPHNVFSKIAHYCGSSFDDRCVSLKSVHRSYSEKQLLVLRAFCRKYKKEPPKSYKNKMLHWLFYRSYAVCFHAMLYAASRFPASWVPRGPLIADDKLQEVREAYQEDWAKLVDHAKRNNV